MTALQLISDHPIIALIMLWLLCELTYKSFGRLIRHLNIRSQGWPPPHCDADGNLKEEPEPESVYVSVDKADK